MLQTVLPALILADAPSRVTLEGGTHNPYAPPFDFLAHAFLPLVNRMGPTVTATPDRPGFFPAGGGRFTVDIEPAPHAKLAPLSMLERSDLISRRAVATVSNLSPAIAERELDTLCRTLTWSETKCEVVELRDGVGPGNTLSVTLAFENVTEVIVGFGTRNRSAEAVAGDVARRCRRYLQTGAPVGEYLADQLLLPFALAGGGSFHTQCLSRHAETHLDLIRRFLNVVIDVEQRGRHGVVITLDRDTRPAPYRLETKNPLSQLDAG